MSSSWGGYSPPWTDEQVAYLRDNYGEIPAKDIAAVVGKTYNAVIVRAHLEGLKSRHRAGTYSLVPGYFRSIDTPIKAYLLGLLAADGWVSDRNQVCLSLGEKDASLVEFARDQIAPGARLKHYDLKTGGRMIQFKVQNAGLAADLSRWGVRPRKSLVMHWPVGLTPELSRSYLHGYFDGDGSLSTARTGRWSLVGGNPSFLASAQDFVLAEAGIRIGGPYQDKRHEHAWSIVATGAPARALDAWLQQDGLGLARKRWPRQE